MPDRTGTKTPFDRMEEERDAALAEVKLTAEVQQLKRDRAAKAEAVGRTLLVIDAAEEAMRRLMGERDEARAKAEVAVAHELEHRAIALDMQKERDEAQARFIKAQDQAESAHDRFIAAKKDAEELRESRSRLMRAWYDPKQAKPVSPDECNLRDGKIALRLRTTERDELLALLRPIYGLTEHVETVEQLRDWLPHYTPPTRTEVKKLRADAREQIERWAKEQAAKGLSR